MVYVVLQINALKLIFLIENNICLPKSNTTLTCEVPQVSALGPFWYLYIKDLHNAIKFYQVHHFADDTNLLMILESPKMLNKLRNYDMKNLTNWLNTNKINLNIAKSELRSNLSAKKLKFEFKIKSNGKKQFSNSVKYKSSHPEVFLRKGVPKICSKLTGEYPCRSAISVKLQSNFTEITLRHGCSTVNLLHIFRTPFLKNTYRRLLL